jgi:hypothetical protein
MDKARINDDEANRVYEKRAGQPKTFISHGEGIKMPCPCGGANENCIRCAGLGEYSPHGGGKYFPLNAHQISLRGKGKKKQKKEEKGPDILPLLAKSGSPREKARAQNKLAARSALQQVSCRICEFRGSRDELYRHMESKHSSAAGRPKALNPADIVLIEYMRCPLCEDHIHRTEFEAHLRARHRTDWGTVEQFVQGAQPKNPLARPAVKPIICTFCEQKVPPQDIDLHLDLQHQTNMGILLKLLSTGTGAAKNSSVRARAEREKEIRDATQRSKSKGVAELSGQDTLEAHRYMGFVVRENGRYGSHPLHDKHDDESKP